MVTFLECFPSFVRMYKACPWSCGVFFLLTYSGSVYIENVLSKAVCLVKMKNPLITPEDVNVIKNLLYFYRNKDKENHYLYLQVSEQCSAVCFHAWSKILAVL